MLFEHNPECGPTSEASVAATELRAAERGLLAEGLSACEQGRAVDRLAEKLLAEWDGLSSDERATGLALIGAVLAEAIATATHEV